MTKKYDFKYHLSMDDNNKNGFAANKIETINGKQKLSGGADGAFFIPATRIALNDKVSAYRLDVGFYSVGLLTQEKFCMWCLMASNLLKSPNLPDFARDICENVVKQFDELHEEINQANRIVH